MTKDNTFYRNFFSIYVALVLQNVVTLSVNLADNIMLGAYCETALAGVAAVNQIQFVYQQLIMALGDGLVILGSQYWGKGQTDPLKKIVVSAMHAALVTGALLFILASALPWKLVGAFTTDEHIIEEGVRYLGIIRFTYPFFAVTQLLLAALRSTETVKIAFRLSVLTFCVNCGINYVLIFGNFGAPRLGAAGAAIGTLTARAAECGVLICYIYILSKKPKLHQECNVLNRDGNTDADGQMNKPANFVKLRLSLRDYLQFDKALAKDYLRITAPMLLVQGLWGLNTALQTVILGHMTAAAIAANSAASTLFLMVKSTAVGAASTASVIIGKAVGAGDYARVREYSVRLQRMFLVIGVLSGIFLFFLRVPVLALYDMSAGTKEMANAFLIILSVVCVGMSYQMPTNNGIIRGGGNALFVVKMDLVSIWLIVLPLSFVMAFVVKASPVAVVCCLNADQIFKCVPAFLMSHYGNWIRKLTRD
ncbi:MAG: polysaccharide biosynthesis C-terminal domain-containing protein [Lachnospiraceae bacterium]